MLSRMSMMMFYDHKLNEEWIVLICICPTRRFTQQSDIQTTATSSHPGMPPAFRLDILNHAHTHTLFYLAQVYANRGDGAKVRGGLQSVLIVCFVCWSIVSVSFYHQSAKYCHVTLDRQLRSKQFDRLVGWCDWMYITLWNCQQEYTRDCVNDKHNHTMFLICKLPVVSCLNHSRPNPVVLADWLPWPIQEWVKNTVTLTEYYLANNLWSMAEHCLYSAYLACPSWVSNAFLMIGTGFLSVLDF